MRWTRRWGALCTHDGELQADSVTQGLPSRRPAARAPAPHSLPGVRQRAWGASWSHRGPAGPGVQARGSDLILDEPGSQRRTPVPAVPSESRAHTELVAVGAVRAESVASACDSDGGAVNTGAWDEHGGRSQEVQRLRRGGTRVGAVESINTVFLKKSQLEENI